MIKKRGKNTKKSSKVKKKVRHVKHVFHSPIRRHHVETSENKIERVLLENFVSLQKVMVNLSTKIEESTKKTSKLLELFEISAKALAEKDFDIEMPSKVNENEQKIMEKMDKMFEQNKVIAKGLTFIHEKNAGMSEPIKRPPAFENKESEKQEPSYSSSSQYAPQKPVQAPAPTPSFKKPRSKSAFPGYEESITEEESIESEKKDSDDGNEG